MPGIVLPSPITTAPGLTVFINEVAKQTGIDSRVVTTWVTAEGAYQPKGTGHFNYLNLRNPDPGNVGVIATSPGGFAEFGSLQDAIASTVNRIKQPFLQRTLAPVLKAGGSPVKQLQAIASSRWDGSGHYIGPYGGKSVVGGRLYDTFAGLFGKTALGGPPTSNPVSGVGSPGGAVTGTGSLPGIPNPLDWVGSLTSWVGGKAAYASLYVGLVLFAIVLALIGVLGLLGVHPSAIARTSMKDAAVAA